MPHYIRRLVCLANSTKKGGRCIAGKDVTSGEWVRPVGDRKSAAVLYNEYKYQQQGCCKLLDVVDIPFLKAEARQHQTENHVIDAGYYWTKRAELVWADLAPYVERPQSLWVNGTHTQPGLNDCIPEAVAATLTSSLLLIQPQNFKVWVGIERPGSQYAKRGVRGEFRYRGVDYGLRITDPDADTTFRGKEDGDYSIENVYLCISLTEPFEHHRCHKLVAAIFSEQQLS